MKALLEIVKINNMDVVTASDTSCLENSIVETPCQNKPFDEL